VFVLRHQGLHLQDAGRRQTGEAAREDRQPRRYPCQWRRPDAHAPQRLGLLEDEDVPQAVALARHDAAGQHGAWTGINVSARKTRTFRIELTVDKCAGQDLVPSNKHNKTAKQPLELAGASTNLYSTEIGIATFTDPVNNQQCLESKTVKVRTYVYLRSFGGLGVWMGMPCQGKGMVGGGRDSQA
jgi:hypothetical protein